MRARKLTKKMIDQAVYEGTEKGKSRYSKFFIWDTTIKGFGLRINRPGPTGKKTFILRYYAGPRERQTTIGEYGLLTLQQARTKARRLLGEVAKGHDPQAEKQARRTAENVAKLSQRYLIEHAEVHKKESSIRNDRQMIRDYVNPKLGHLKVAAVTKADITKLISSLRDKPTTANRVRSLLSKMFNLAEDWGLREDNSNPCRRVKRFKENKKDRFLSKDELGRLEKTLRDEENSGISFSAAGIRLLLYTGCRRGEILNLRWEEVDLERNLLHLSDSKTGKKTIYLSTDAVKVLSHLPRTMGFQYVIEGRYPDKPRADLNKPWNRIRKAAGIEDVRLHDLRHTLAATAAEIGIPLHTIGSLLGHSQTSTTERYAHLAPNPKHEAMNRIGAVIQKSMEGNFNTNVN